MKKILSFAKKEKEVIISIAILLVGQGFLYYCVKQIQSNPTYINYYLDNKIPFIGWFIYPYNMFYPLTAVTLYFLFKEDKRKYYKAYISCIIGIIICDLIFICMPTIMLRPKIPNCDPITDFIINVTYFFDEPPLNCFPSIHCLFCFQIIFGLIGSKCKRNKKLIIIPFSLLIIISTLFIKQHYIYDIVSAFLICLIANSLEELFKIYDKISLKYNKKTS